MLPVQQRYRGLVHNSELDEAPTDGPERIVEVGDLLTVKIIDVDPKRHRIALSHLQALAADHGGRTP